MRSDIEIAQSTKLRPITEIAEQLGLNPDEIEIYAGYKAKITEKAMRRYMQKPDGKLVLVTAINPTPAGEGKTTTTIGLGQAMQKIGKNAIIALREPSLGPVFGMKGGAAGGGYAQVVPMEDINLHFTGDMHAITMANNLLCAVIDNHIHQGNTLQIDPARILFKRVVDMNDRALRQIVVGLGPRTNGQVREEGFNITVASEIMAILCLCEDIDDLKARIGRILVGYTFDGQPVYCRDLKVQGAMCALLKDAIKPNLVQTLEHTPCLMHGGPFANIAHGCNSVRATKLAMKMADICITEAGFGADLGGEKFLNIKCRSAGLSPSAVVVVATIRALKYNAGIARADLATPNADAVAKGIVNLQKHVENMQHFGLPVVVALNRFGTDSDEEINTVKTICENMNARFCLSDVFAKGGEGGIELAQAVCDVLENETANFHPSYDTDASIEEKIKSIVKDIYGGKDVVYTTKARKALGELKALGMDKLPVCMAKTQYSLSDDPTALGRPKDFTVTVTELRPSAGAGFVVALTGEILTMPGLPKQPAAEMIDLDADGNITGLF